MNTNILVTGVRAPAALHLCRILRENGNKVFAADSVSYALTKASNTIEAFFLYPSPKWRTEAFITSLIKFIRQNNISLLIPTCEESFYISMYKEKLSPICEVFTGDFDQMKLLHNKNEFIKYVNRLGFMTPKTLNLDENTAKKELQDFFEDRIVLKRIYSRFSDHVVFLHKNEFEPDFAQTSWIAQEKISGIQYCSYSIARDGQLLAHSAYETAFTAGLGATISFQYSERQDIENFVKTIVKDLNFTGQISFDFIVNGQDVAIPIECNPRTTSGLHLFNRKLGPCMTGSPIKTLYPEKDSKMAITLALIAYAADNFKRKRPFKQWLHTLLTHRILHGP